MDCRVHCENGGCRGARARVEISTAPRVTHEGIASALSLVRGVDAVAGYRQYRLDAQPST